MQNIQLEIPVVCSSNINKAKSRKKPSNKRQCREIYIRANRNLLVFMWFSIQRLYVRDSFTKHMRQISTRKLSINTLLLHLGYFTPPPPLYSSVYMVRMNWSCCWRLLFCNLTIIINVSKPNTMQPTIQYIKYWSHFIMLLRWKWTKKNSSRMANETTRLPYFLWFVAFNRISLSRHLKISREFLLLLLFRYDISFSFALPAVFCCLVAITLFHSSWNEFIADPGTFFLSCSLVRYAKHFESLK